MTQEQITTLLYVIVIVVGALFFVAVALLYKEYKTLSDKVPDNHITAVFRVAFKKQPGAFLIVIILLTAALFYLGGHLAWE
jgi:formate hydrogenlyase subunit 3/multisubunit Na+/H+ antiporter MnhD subunit